MIQYDPRPSDLFVSVVEPGFHPSRFDHFKTWFWNLILPPHIRLSFTKPKHRRDKNGRFAK